MNSKRFIYGMFAIVMGVLLQWTFLPAAGAIGEALEEAPLPNASAFELNTGVDASDIPSEKVSQFVEAYLEVVALIDRREAELQGAETDSESLQIQQEIQAQAFDLIQAAGLSLQEYWQLLGLANTDSEFRERILAQLDEAIS